MQVVRKRGGMLELSVDIDGERVYSAGALSYPLPKRVVAAAERAMAPDS